MENLIIRCVMIVMFSIAIFFFKKIKSNGDLEILKENSKESIIHEKDDEIDLDSLMRNVDFLNESEKDIVLIEDSMDSITSSHYLRTSANLP